MTESKWFQVENVAEIPSPALLVYPDRIRENIRLMLEIASDSRRLRPHVKTHKLAEIVQMQQSAGVQKFKCATLAEAEMSGDCAAADVLLAYPLVGPNIDRFMELTRRFPQTQFAALADDESALRQLSAAASRSSRAIPVFLDLDCGMHRTGVVPGSEARALYELLNRLPGLQPGGLHAYDGHIHDLDPLERTRQCQAAFAPVEAFRAGLERDGLAVPTVVAGGTPTFHIHARRPGVECSPGTSLLWDAGYKTKLPDLPFLTAAAVLTRVISKPAGNRLCLDLGHKAIAAENPHPRVLFPELPDAKAVMHSEEHLVVETPDAGRYAVGDALYGIPWHICPTVALHSQAVVIENRRAIAQWRGAARERKLTI